MTDNDFTPASGQTNPAASADQIKSAAHHAEESVREAAARAKERLSSQGGEKLDAASTTAGESLRAVADQLRQAGEGLGEDQGWARQAFSQGADGLERVSGYLREGRFDTFARDLQGFARNNPAAFLAGSVAVGFLAARVAKTAAKHVAPGASGSTSMASADVAPGPFESASDAFGGDPIQGVS